MLRIWSNSNVSFVVLCNHAKLSMIRFEQRRLTQRAHDPRQRASGHGGGSLRVFKQFAWLEVGSGKLGLSRPTHQRVPITCSVKGLERKRGRFFFGECFARPIKVPFVVGFNTFLFLFRRSLTAQTELRHPHQNFFSGSNPPWYILTHKSGDVVLNTQLHERIFGELLVGQSLARLFRQTPGP